MFENFNIILNSKLFLNITVMQLYDWFDLIKTMLNSLNHRRSLMFFFVLNPCNSDLNTFN